MSDLRKSSRGLKLPLWLVSGTVMLFLASESVVAQVSEIDSYDRAVTSQTKEAALTFLEEFRSSHLVGDLIESLRPDVARAVCADLPSGVSRARRACEQLRTAPVAEAPKGSEERAGGTAQSTVVAAPTQPIEKQPIGGMPSSPAIGVAAAMPQSAAPAAGGQSELDAPAPATAGAGSTADPTTAATGSALYSSGLPEPTATAPPTPIESRPTVYVRPESAANILAQATEGSVVIGTAAGNTPLTVAGRDRSWLKVLVPGMAGRAGWVHASGLQSDAGGIKVGPASAAVPPPLTPGASTAQAPAPQVTTNASSTVVPSTATPSVATSAANIPAGGPAVHIWLASLESRELAEHHWRDLQAVYGDLLADLQLTLRQVDLGPEKGGIWYRIYAGPLAGRDNARALCAEIKSRPPKSNCLVVVE